MQKHDLFRHRGLGKNGYNIYMNLRDKGILSFKDLQGFTGIKKRTLYRKLELMAGINLIRKVDNKYMLIPGHDLDKAANSLGTHGQGVKQKARHKAERENYIDDIKEYKEKEQAKADNSIKH